MLLSASRGPPDQSAAYSGGWWWLVVVEKDPDIAEWPLLAPDISQKTGGVGSKSNTEPSTCPPDQSAPYSACWWWLVVVEKDPDIAEWP